MAHALEHAALGVAQREDVAGARKVGRLSRRRRERPAGGRAVRSRDARRGAWPIGGGKGERGQLMGQRFDGLLVDDSLSSARVPCKKSTECVNAVLCDSVLAVTMSGSRSSSSRSPATAQHTKPLREE